jgi:hypothetical protein
MKDRELSATVRGDKIICNICDMTVSKHSPKLMDVHMEIHMPYPRATKTVSGGK